MKLIVITADFGAAANVGGPVARTARSFELPKEIAEYIERQSKETVYRIIDAVLEFDQEEPPR